MEVVTKTWVPQINTRHPIINAQRMEIFIIPSANTTRHAHFMTGISTGIGYTGCTSVSIEHSDVVNQTFPKKSGPAGLNAGRYLRAWHLNNRAYFWIMLKKDSGTGTWNAWARPPEAGRRLALMSLPAPPEPTSGTAE